MNKKEIKYLVIDVDGTLTDGIIYMGNHGELMKAFSVKDGCGIRDILIPRGIIPIVITGRKSNIVYKRCKEIGIEEIYQGVNNKFEKMSSIISNFSRVAYIGDDINDLPCMISVKEMGGIVGCPKDAVKKIIEISDFVADYSGGNGAVRDFIEWLIKEH